MARVIVAHNPIDWAQTLRQNFADFPFLDRKIRYNLTQIATVRVAERPIPLVS